MTNIILPEEEKDEEEELKYKPTEEDEEIFFLMYHMNISPNLAADMDKDYRKWVISRFIMQKHMEKEAMQQHRLMSQLGGIQGLKA